MNKYKITQNQYTFIVLSNMIGVGILSMASSMSATAHQDGWITTIIGGIYPLFVVVTAGIMDKKLKDSDFWSGCNEIYGKPITYLFAFIFLFNFLTAFASVLSGFANVMKQTILINFLSPISIIVPTIVLITLISICGIDMLGKICELYFYLTIPLVIIPLFFITKGSITNIQPILSDYEKIVEAIPSALYAFGGVEICYIIISRISNKKNTIKAGFLAVGITTLIYTFVVFISIYYLGWELTSELEYPLLYIIETIHIPILSNFRALFIFFWSGIILRTMTCESYACSYLLSRMLKINYKTACVLTSIIVFGYSLLMLPEYNRKMILDILMPYFSIYFVGFGFLTTIIVFIKYRGGKN